MLVCKVEIRHTHVWSDGECGGGEFETGEHVAGHELLSIKINLKLKSSLTKFKGLKSHLLRTPKANLPLPFDVSL